MSRNTLASDRRRRKLITAAWFLAVSLVVIILIYKELTAVLYILATLGVTVLLLMVAFSKLSESDSVDDKLDSAKDAARVAK
jgi:hypothetical protein